MIDIYATKQYAEEILEAWLNSNSPINLRIKKERRNQYLISEDHDCDQNIPLP